MATLLIKKMFCNAMLALSLQKRTFYAPNLLEIGEESLDFTP